ncbi:MAG: ABC transporter ATP-binding protein [Pseudomonadota bacterium]
MISAQGLTKFYGDNCAIDNLDFDIQSGEIVGILGLNGAGKSTALRILSCLLLPTSGTVRINNLDILENPDKVRSLVGFLPEIPPLYGEMTVEAYLTFAGQLRGLSRSQAKARLEEVLKITDTKNVRRQVISSLSHGYRKRVGIGQAIIHEPKVLILDEPIAGLDPVQIVEMRQMVRGLKGKHTILISSHILYEISQTCDRILVIKDGKIVATGSEEELTSKLVTGQKLCIAVRGDFDQAVTLIRGMEHVISCEKAIAVLHHQKEEGVHYFEVECAQDIREAVSKKLVASGFGLRQLSPAEPELESIFLQLTHKSPRPKIEILQAKSKEVAS